MKCYWYLGSFQANFIATWHLQLVITISNVFYGLRGEYSKTVVSKLASQNKDIFMR